MADLQFPAFDEVEIGGGIGDNAFPAFDEVEIPDFDSVDAGGMVEPKQRKPRLGIRDTLKARSQQQFGVEPESTAHAIVGNAPINRAMRSADQKSVVDLYQGNFPDYKGYDFGAEGGGMGDWLTPPKETERLKALDDADKLATLLERKGDFAKESVRMWRQFEEPKLKPEEREESLKGWLQKDAERELKDRIEAKRAAGKTLDEHERSIWNKMVVGAAENVGYQAAFTVHPGVALGTAFADRQARLATDEYELDEDGRLYLNKAGDSEGAAAGKALAGAVAETGIEIVGGEIAGKLFGKVARLILNGVAKKAPVSANLIGRAIKKYGQLAKVTKMGDPIGETFFEEYPQALVDSGIGLDLKQSETEGKPFAERMVQAHKDFDPAEVMLSMAFLMGGQTAMSTASATMDHTTLNRNLDNSLKLFGGLEDADLKGVSTKDKILMARRVAGTMTPEKVEVLTRHLDAKAQQALKKAYDRQNFYDQAQAEGVEPTFELGGDGRNPYVDTKSGIGIIPEDGKYRVVNRDGADIGAFNSAGEAITEAKKQSQVNVVLDQQRQKKADYAMKEAERLAGGMPVRVFNTEAEMLQEIPEIGESPDYQEGITGVRHKGGMVLVLDNLISPSEVVRTIMHEGGAHEGIRRALGDKAGLDTFLGKLGGKQFEVGKRRLKLGGQEFADQLTEADEALATVYENRLADPTAYQKSVSWLHGQLRKVAPNLKYTDADIEVLMADAQSRVMDARVPGSVDYIGVDRGYSGADAAVEDARARMSQEARAAEQARRRRMADDANKPRVAPVDDDAVTPPKAPTQPQQRGISKTERRAELIAGMEQEGSGVSYPVEDGVRHEPDQDRDPAAQVETQAGDTAQQAVRQMESDERLKARYPQEYQDALGAVDGDAENAIGLLREQTKAMEESRRVSEQGRTILDKLDNKRTLTPQDARFLAANDILGPDLYRRGYRRDKSTGEWRHIDEPTTPPSTPTAPTSPPQAPVADAQAANEPGVPPSLSPDASTVEAASDLIETEPTDNTPGGRAGVGDIVQQEPSAAPEATIKESLKVATDTAQAAQAARKPPELMTPEEAGAAPIEPSVYPPRSEKQRFGPKGYANATPEQIAQHKAELKAYRQANQLAKDRTAKSNAHWNAVEAAAKAGNPINAESFEWRYPSEKPEGYVREGDRYVFKGAEQAPAKDIRGTPPAPKGGKKGKADTVIADVPGGQTALTAPPAPQEPARPAIPSAPADEDASRQEALRKSKVFAEKLKAKYPPVDVRTDEILVQVEGFKQFKEDADPKTGVVEDQRLMGKPYSLAENPIVVMEMNDGRKVIVTGRHRLDLYKRNNIATIPAHIIRESDGWTPDDAGVLDAFLNILDEKGSIHDYVKFFDEVKPTASEAEADGLTSREKGRTAFLISQSASPDVRASINFDAKYRRRKENGEHADITAAQAAAIAEAAPVGEAPENEAIQREVLRDAFKGMTPLELRNRAQVYKRQIASSGMPESAEMDLFGDSGAGLREQADRVADAISAKQSELMDLRAVLNNALNRGDALQLTKAQAKALGITNVKDKAQLQKALDATKNELAYWSVEILDEGRMNQARRAAGVPVVDDVPKQPTTREVKTGLKGQTKTVPVDAPPVRQDVKTAPAVPVAAEPEIVLAFRAAMKSETETQGERADVRRAISETAWSLMGPRNIGRRQVAIESLTGKRPPQGKAGVEQLKQALTAWHASQSDGKPTLSLESVTTDDIDAEASARNAEAVRKAMLERAASPLEGNAGDLTADLFGEQEGETPLFNARRDGQSADTQAAQVPGEDSSPKPAAPARFPRGAMANTVYNEDGVSYTGRIVSEDSGKGTVTIRATKERKKGLKVTAGDYGLDKQGRQITKDVTVPAELVRVIDAVDSGARRTAIERAAMDEIDREANAQLKEVVGEQTPEVTDEIDAVAKRDDSENADPDAEYEGTRFRKVSQDDAEDTLADMRREYGESRLAAFEKSDGKGKAPWNYPSFARVKKIWQDYARMGFVRDERGMDDIAHNIVANIAAMDFETQMAGHSDNGLGASETLEEFDIEPWDEDKINRYYDWTGLHFSDYAMAPLKRIATQILMAESAEEQLILVDRVFNTVHMASDLLAENFIEGGAKALNALSGTGEHGDARNTRFRRAVTPDPDAEYEGTRFRRVSDPKLISRLENGKKVKAYRAMQLVDGKLYPPMAAKVNGEWINPTDLNTWLEAEELPQNAFEKNGRWYFKLDKGNGSSMAARYNPYFHSSLSPLNDQFTSASNRPNLVTVEVEIPLEDIESGYKADKAKDAVGEHVWKAGPVAAQLPASKARKVILSRYNKVVRIVPDSEVAEKIATLLEGEGISIPENVVTPSLKDELVKRRVDVAPAEGRSRSLRASNATVTPPDDIRFRIDAFHGTPHTFEPEPDAPFGKVKKEKVGTGEGAAAYGWGVLYAAESKGVAETYTKAGDPAQRFKVLAHELAKTQGRSNTVEVGGRVMSDYEMAQRIQDRDAEFIAKLPESIRSKIEQAERGNLYHVELDFDPEDTLDWHKPLSEQSDKVRQALFMDYGSMQGFNADPSGEQIYRDLSNRESANESGLKGRVGYEGENKRAASEYLASLGIKGIRYADQQSRTNLRILKPTESVSKKWVVGEAPNGPNKYFDNEADAKAFYNDELAKRTYNYVVFNEADIRVVGRNGETLTPTQAMDEQAAENDETRFRRRSPATPEQDAAYMRAVESGDTATAQRMVDEAARAAGYNVGPVWHGTRSKARPTEFDTNRQGQLTGNDIPGTYFTDTKEYARAVGMAGPLGSKYEPDAYYLRLSKMAGRDQENAARYVPDAGMERGAGTHRGIDGKRYLLKGRDGAEIRARLEAQGYDGVDRNWSLAHEWIAFSPSQIKSADPVTRDDAGRVVPLSERFNEASNDIRFRVIPPANTTPSQEPPAGDELLKDSDYWNAIRGAYKPGESSRTKPIRELPELRVGMWRVSSLNGVRGRDIDQLRWLDPSTLSLAENMVERNEEGRGWDADRYADWNNQGLEAPPIEVVETDNGVFRVIDGHRRVAAAKKTGKPVLAWVSPSMDVPEGMRYDGDPSKPIVKTSLTIEAWRNGTAMRTEPLTGGFSDYGIANDIRFRKQTETPGNYRGQHRAPTGEFGEGSLDAMDRTYPKDIYDQDAGRIYGDGSSPILDSKIAALIRRLRGKPDAEVTVFRAVPKGVQTEIEPGNWVTPVREYAEMHGGRFDEGMDIIERKVKAGELFTEGNSLYEYGWQPDSDIRFRVGRGQTETPEFKAWFGNSAVVDADGKPLVVYHGTGATDIESFRPEGGRDGEWQKALSHFKAAQANNDRYGYMSFRSGTFFSPDPEYAGNYAAEGSGVLYPVYIKAKNPVYFDTRTGTATGVDKNKTPDALIIRDSGKILEIAVIDPTQIKSAIGNRGTFDPDNPDIRFRRAVTPEQDKAYMDAVERGDMETAQRMVDEAAKKAGYTTLAFKGMLSKDWRTGKTINTIKSVNGDWAGFFSSDKAVADKFRAAFATMGEAKTVSVYLDMAGADVVDAKGGKARDVQFDNVSPANRRNGMLDRINRSDRGVIVENTEDEKTVYIPKHPAQIKSADPVTYDDAGHVIPLSERFNDGSDDIRFRKQTETPEFKRWFRDSKVVDADGKPLMVYHGTIHSTNSLQGGKGHRKGLHSDGIWFSRSGEQASEYAMAGGIGKYTPQVYPVYLSIQNPAKIYGQDAGYETVEKLKSQGYDGAYDAQTGYWIAFDATQIKSATGNRGTFDPDNPDIRFRPGPRRAPVLTPDQQAVMREAERAMEQTPAPATRLAQAASAAQEAPILGLIRWGTGQDVADKIDRKLGDFRIPIKRLYERVMEKGGKFNRDTMEYAALAERRNSLFGVLAGDMEERFVLPMTKALRDGGWSLDDLNHYAQALHAPDFNRMIAEARGGREAPGRQPLGGDATDLLSALEDDGWAGKGLSDAKAKETVDWFDSKPNAGRLREAAMLLVDMNRRILDQRVADGLMARQQAETWKNLSPYYVPLRKMQEAEEGDVAAPAGRNLSSREIKRAVGHFGTLNENSVVNSLTQMDAALYRGLMNKERQNLWRFLEANPDPDSYVLHEAVPTREVKVRNADGTFTVQQQVDQGFVRKASPQDKEGTIVPVKFDGDVKYIEFKGVNARTAARAVKENALQGRAFAASPFIRGLGHMFKGVRTIYAVDFMLRNGQSDGLDAALIMAAEGNGKQALEAVKAVPHAWKVLWQHENGRPVTGPYAELFDEYRRSGSIMSNRWVDSTGDNWLKVLEKEMGIKPDHSKPVQAVIAVKDGIERLNAMVELGTRFSVYAGMRKNGASVQDAADYARNITVDFEKKGELTPVLNSVYHFSNVAIQGNRRFMQAMLKNPARGARVVGGVFAAGFLTALWNMLGFDDDDDEYDKLKDYHKYGRIAARIPGTNKMVQARFRGIPGWIYFQGVAAAETAFGKRTAGSFAMQAPITFLDTVNWLGDSSDLLTAVLPPMLDPLAQFATNKQWTGRPLVPGLEYATHKPRSQLAYKSTPKVFKAVAEAINKLGGGDEVTKSNAMLDNSPEAYKYWWSFLTGSMLNVPTRLFDVMVRLAKGEDVPVKSVPFVRDFFLDMDDIENNEPFYQAKTAFEEVQYRYKGYDERGERGKMGELRRQHRYADRESVASERLKDMLRRIDDLKDRADAATGERKEQLNRQRVEAQRKFIELIERYDARVRQP